LTIRRIRRPQPRFGITRAEIVSKRNNTTLIPKWPSTILLELHRALKMPISDFPKIGMKIDMKIDTKSACRSRSGGAGRQRRLVGGRRHATHAHDALRTRVLAAQYGCG
jgi:hypothetical protein